MSLTVLTPLKAKPRTLSKCLNGREKVEAQMAYRTLGDFAKGDVAAAHQMTVVSKLMEYSLTSKQLAAMTGMPLARLRIVRKNAGIADKKSGRYSESVVRMMNSVPNHLRASIFFKLMAVLEEKHPEMETAERFLNSLEMTELTCGEYGAEDITPRYLCSLMQKAASKMALQECKRCGISYVRADDVLVPDALALRTLLHDCPSCRFLKWQGDTMSGRGKGGVLKDQHKALGRRMGIIEAPKQVESDVE